MTEVIWRHFFNFLFLVFERKSHLTSVKISFRLPRTCVQEKRVRIFLRLNKSNEIWMDLQIYLQWLLGN